MSKYILRDEQSTAQAVASELKKRGIPQKAIMSKHIMHVYSSMNRAQCRPDLASIKNILPDQRKPNANEACPINAIIVETRKHPAMEFVINNFVRNTNIPIQIFHGQNNLDYIMSTSIASQVNNERIHITQLQIDSLSAHAYNSLFLSKRFWRNVIGRNKILVFQTDTILCKHSDYTVNDFISYDYIGSKWARRRPVGLIIDGGNGGLSIRDWPMMYDCLNRFSPENWTGGEDGYFAFHIDLIGGQIGKAKECAKFGTQQEFLFNSWGAHQISCLNSRDAIDFLRYCDEARFMKSKRVNLKEVVRRFLWR